MYQYVPDKILQAVQQHQQYLQQQSVDYSSYNDYIEYQTHKLSFFEYLKDKKEFEEWKIQREYEYQQRKEESRKRRYYEDERPYKRSKQDLYTYTYNDYDIQKAIDKILKFNKWETLSDFKEDISHIVRNGNKVDIPFKYMEHGPNRWVVKTYISIKGVSEKYRQIYNSPEFTEKLSSIYEYTFSIRYEVNLTFNARIDAEYCKKYGIDITDSKNTVLIIFKQKI
jgi:hypothetical protein